MQIVEELFSEEPDSPYFLKIEEQLNAALQLHPPPGRAEFSGPRAEKLAAFLLSEGKEGKEEPKEKGDFVSFGAVTFAPSAADYVLLSVDWELCLVKFQGEEIQALAWVESSRDQDQDQEDQEEGDGFGQIYLLKDNIAVSTPSKTLLYEPENLRCICRRDGPGSAVADGDSLIALERRWPERKYALLRLDSSLRECGESQERYHVQAFDDCEPGGVNNLALDSKGRIFLLDELGIIHVLDKKLREIFAADSSSLYVEIVLHAKGPETGGKSRGKVSALVEGEFWVQISLCNRV